MLLISDNEKQVLCTKRSKRKRKRNNNQNVNVKGKRLKWRWIVRKVKVKIKIKHGALAGRGMKPAKDEWEYFCRPASFNLELGVKMTSLERVCKRGVSLVKDKMMDRGASRKRRRETEREREEKRRRKEERKETRQQNAFPFFYSEQAGLTYIECAHRGNCQLLFFLFFRSQAMASSNLNRELCGGSGEPGGASAPEGTDSAPEAAFLLERRHKLLQNFKKYIDGSIVTYTLLTTIYHHLFLSTTSQGHLCQY